MSEQIAWKHRPLKMRLQTRSHRRIRFPQCTSSEKELMKTETSVEISFHLTNELHFMWSPHNPNSLKRRRIISKVIMLRQAHEIYTSSLFLISFSSEEPKKNKTRQKNKISERNECQQLPRDSCFSKKDVIRPRLLTTTCPAPTILAKPQWSSLVRKAHP